MQHSLFYDWKNHYKLFWLGVVVKPGEEDSDTHDGVFRAAPGFAQVC